MRGRSSESHRIKGICLSPQATTREAISCLDRTGIGIVLVTDPTRVLLGTVTDGDIRRLVLTGASLDTPLSSLLESKSRSRYAKPTTAPIGTDPDALSSLMREASVRHIPIVDADNCVVDIVVSDDFPHFQKTSLRAVIMAGGMGKRLQPLTRHMPKPMLPVGGRPLMEHLIDRLRDSGIRNISVTTHYLSEKIVNHFGDGRRFGVDMEYVNEHIPLGTAGAIGLVEDRNDRLLVINGDILTEVDFKSLIEFHAESMSPLTVCVRKYEMNVPYGVVTTADNCIQTIIEKPSFDFFVNAGIYLLEPELRTYVDSGTRLEMPDLIRTLIERQIKVACFPIREYWLDIGQPLDYERANEYASRQYAA